MSEIIIDCALSFIPENTQFVPSAEIIESALEKLKELFPYADEQNVETFETSQYFNPELLANSVTCPVCGVCTVRGSSADERGRAWFAMIDDMKSQLIETDRTTLPQCGHSVLFADLNFDCASGFARFALTARFTYFDEELMSDAVQQSNETSELSRLIGEPLKAVRTLYALLPADRQLCKALMSSDDEERLKAALVLDSREKGHFEDHSIAATYIEDHAEQLLSAYKNTKHSKVREWVLNFLGQAAYACGELTEYVAAELHANSKLLPHVLYVIYQTPQQFQHLKNALKELHKHRDEKVRWRVALALKFFSLDYADDMEVVRTLMLDDFYAARLEGVFAFKKILGADKLRESDRSLLNAVIEKDGTGSASFYAKELLAQ